jgi:hypothetical protein
MMYDQEFCIMRVSFDPVGWRLFERAAVAVIIGVVEVAAG